MNTTTHQANRTGQPLPAAMPRDGFAAPASRIDTMRERLADIMPSIVEGNLADLDSEQRQRLYEAMCEVVGLNPLSRPFDFLPAWVKEKTVENGKQVDSWVYRVVLYARRDCADQLRAKHKLSCAVLQHGPSANGALYIAHARVTDPSGRFEDDLGVTTLTTPFKANDSAYADGKNGKAIMVAITKAKRRATLGFCGLAMIDELDIADMAAAGDLRIDQTRAIAGTEKTTAPPQEAPPASSGPRTALPPGWTPDEKLVRWTSTVIERARAAKAWDTASAHVSDRLAQRPADLAWALDRLQTALDEASLDQDGGTPPA